VTRHQKYPKKIKTKTYHGSRHIGNYENTNPQINNPIPYSQNQTQQPYDNVYNQSGIQSRINAIGTLLGVTPNELSNQNTNVDYGRIAQQMAQQYQSDPSYQFQGVNQQLPATQTSMQRPAPDTDALYRYMTAANQQSPLDPTSMNYLMQQQQQQQQLAQLSQMSQVPQMPYQAQMPQTPYSMAAQQIPAQIPGQVPQVPYQTMTQQGGANNRFFFR